MRRKNRKWVALAVVLYLGLMYSAVRWSISQRMPEGNIFNKIEQDGIRRLNAERAQQAKLAPKPTGESRLAAAGPAYIAARYDDTHVAFIVTTNTESRFASSPWMRTATLTKVSAPANPVAPLAGLQELWEPDNSTLHFFPKIIQDTRRGDQWILNLSPGLTIPVSIEHPIVAPTGCNLALGFLAEVPLDQQAKFATAPGDYFAVRHMPVAPSDPPVIASIGELHNWKFTAAAAQQIEPQLNARMKQELAAIDARLRANAGTPGALAHDVPVASPLPRTREWLHADKALADGEGKLDYDVHAYALSPDGDPRLFVRARWTLAGAPVFVMIAWFRQNSDAATNAGASPLTENAKLPLPTAKLSLLFADSSWSKSMREGESRGSLGDHLDFATVLNTFDADRDGWAELLVHSDQGASSALTLSLYTDEGLVPMKQPLTRETATADSCLDP